MDIIFSTSDSTETIRFLPLAYSTHHNQSFMNPVCVAASGGRVVMSTTRTYVTETAMMMVKQ